MEVSGNSCLSCPLSDPLPVWCRLDDLEQAGLVSGKDAMDAKREIYRLMQEQRLEPDEVVRVGVPTMHHGVAVWNPPPERIHLT